MDLIGKELRLGSIPPLQSPCQSRAPSHSKPSAGARPAHTLISLPVVSALHQPAMLHLPWACRVCRGLDWARPPNLYVVSATSSPCWLHRPVAWVRAALDWPAPYGSSMCSAGSRCSFRCHSAHWPSMRHFFPSLHPLLPRVGLVYHHPIPHCSGMGLAS